MRKMITAIFAVVALTVVVRAADFNYSYPLLNESFMEQWMKQYFDGITSGTVSSGKAVIVDTNKNISGFGAGTGTASYAPMGTINVNTTSTGTGADTTEDTLTTYSLPANTLSAAGKGLKIRAWGTTAANADNKTMKLYFGSEVIATPTAATNNKNWYLELEVYKTAANAQVVDGRGIVDTTAVTPYFATGTETDTAAITVKATGTNGTGNANDIVIKGFIVEMLN